MMKCVQLRQGKRTILASFTLVLGLSTLPGTASAQTPPDAAQPQPYAEVNGVRFAVGLGDVIYQAQPTGGTCTISDVVSVGAAVPPTVEEAFAVGWKINEQCQLVIDRVGTATAAEVEVDPAVPEQAGVVAPEVGIGNVYVPPPSIRTDCGAYRGWVKGVVREQFGVDSTARYTELRWIECGNQSSGSFQVQQPHASDGWCYHSSFPGWAPVEDCSSRWYDQSPGLIWKEGWGYYKWFDPASLNPTPSIHYKMYVAFDVGPLLPPSWYQRDCTIPQGALPYFWDLRCYGKRVKIS